MMQRITKIKKGSLLLAEGTRLPESVLLQSSPCTPDWSLLKDVNPKGLKELIQQAGWKFFYLATRLETTGWGWDKETAMRKAIQKLTALTKAAKYNCIEIEELDARRLWGISFLRLTAHSRQIQEAPFLTGGKARISYASD